MLFMHVIPLDDLYYSLTPQIMHTNNAFTVQISHFIKWTDQVMSVTQQYVSKVAHIRHLTQPDQTKPLSLLNYWLLVFNYWALIRKECVISLSKRDTVLI